MVVSDFFFTQTLNTLRSVEGAGRRSAATSYLTGVECTDVFPLDTDVDEVKGALTFRQGWQLFTKPADIVVGDYIVLGGDTYGVVNVAPWPKTNTKFLHLRVEEEVVPGA